MWGSQPANISHTILSGTILHKNATFSSHLLSITEYYKSCKQPAQTMLTATQANLGKKTSQQL